MSIQIALPADVNQVDHTGFVWAYLDQATDTALVVPGSLIVAGDDEDPVMARVINIVDGASTRKIVHLDVLGLADEFIEALELAEQTV
ncbi:MAG TPA: hypothetical protein VNQ73_12880 [Ilumatobacter sp.]|nr:hypothetical protein [Ilumatobacter sp.]